MTSHARARGPIPPHWRADHVRPPAHPSTIRCHGASLSVTVTAMVGCGPALYLVCPAVGVSAQALEATQWDAACLEATAIVRDKLQRMLADLDAGAVDAGAVNVEARTAHIVAKAKKRDIVRAFLGQPVHIRVRQLKALGVPFPPEPSDAGSWSKHTATVRALGDYARANPDGHAEMLTKLSELVEADRG